MERDKIVYGMKIIARLADQMVAELHTQPFTDAWVDWFADRYGPVGLT